MVRALDRLEVLRALLPGLALFAALTALRSDDGEGSGALACGLGAGGAGLGGAKVAAKGCGGGAKALSGAGKLGAAKLGAKVGAAGLAGSEAAGLTHLAPALDDVARAGAVGTETVVSGTADDLSRALSGSADDLAAPAASTPGEGIYLTADDLQLRLPPRRPAPPEPHPVVAVEDESTAAKVAEELGPDAVQQLAPEDDTGR